MKEDESIQEMHTRFTSIINELHSLGEIIPTNKMVRKILSVLPGSCESKFNAITEAKDLQKLTIDELIVNIKTYEMKRKKDLERREPRKEKNPVLKASNKDSSSDESDMEYLPQRFQKMIRKNGEIPRKGSSSGNFKGNDCCHKCGKLGYFIKDCSLHKQEHYKTNTEKAAKRNQGNSSGESECEDDQGDTSMMVADNGSSEYESIFALMAKSDEDKEEDEMSLANVLIDAYHSLINEKNALIEEIGDIEKEGDNMVVFIVDLKEQVEEVTRENNLLKQ
ncbi:uncharacterized protein [Nicotiana tomentosiformis]|uniref:uncharacterized protein n=1 Tax=Nicotiana tomentosiformis TaxID=4098 RepID=UPI00388C722C